MPQYLTIAVYIFAAVSTGMMAGIYFIFSNTVMPALAAMAKAPAAEAMQLINRIILNPLFFILFMGSALASVVIVTITLFGAGNSSGYIGLCAALLLITTFISTMAFNVPLNNKLDEADLNTEVAKEIWAHYLDKWVKWNHFRTLLSFVSAILFSVELMRIAL